MRIDRICPVAVVLTAGLVLTMTTRCAPGSHAESTETWRRQRLARLTADDGWLTVVGLFWLQEGPNRFGAGPGNDIALPEGKAPDFAGTFTLAGAGVRVTVAPGAAVTAEGRPVTSMTLRSDRQAGGPDILTLGDLSLFVIERGGKPAIRLKDRTSRARREFKGLEYFPIDPAFRVTARFEPYTPPRTIAIPNVLGQSEDLPCPGAVVFTLRGREYRLEPVIEEPGDTQLFYIFSDATTGRETYGSGRFLYSEMPKDGTVVLDFNRAYTPPCGFTRYATCPLPPPQNRLDVRIEAGEKHSGSH